MHDGPLMPDEVLTIAAVTARPKLAEKTARGAASPVAVPAFDLRCPAIGARP